MFTWIWIFEIVLLGLALARRARAWNPHGHGHSCELFERDAYFDPYKTIDSLWKIFYFWGNTSELHPIIFSLPSKDRIKRFRTVVEVVEPGLEGELQWRHATLIMEPRPGVMVLLLYQGTPGAFRAVVKMERRTEARPHPVPLIKLSDIRLKIVDRYIGMMACEEMTMYAMSRLYELPETEEGCEEAAAKLGFPKGGGRSHLYLINSTKRDIDDEL